MDLATLFGTLFAADSTLHLTPASAMEDYRDYGRSIEYQDYDHLMILDAIRNNYDNDYTDPSFARKLDSTEPIDHEMYSHGDIFSDSGYEPSSINVDDTVNLIYQILNSLPFNATRTPHDKLANNVTTHDDPSFDYEPLKNLLLQNQYGEIDRTPVVAIPDYEDFQVEQNDDNNSVTLTDSTFALETFASEPLNTTTAATFQSPTEHVEYTTLISLLNNMLGYFGSSVTILVGFIDCITSGLLTALVSSVLMLYNFFFISSGYCPLPWETSGQSCGCTMVFGKPMGI